jgi:hypothetical protein
MSVLKKSKNHFGRTARRCFLVPIVYKKIAMFAIVATRAMLGWSHGHSMVIEVAGTFQQLTSPHRTNTMSSLELHRHSPSQTYTHQQSNTNEEYHNGRQSSLPPRRPHQVVNRQKPTTYTHLAHHPSALAFLRKRLLPLKTSRPRVRKIFVRNLVSLAPSQSSE